MITAALVVTMGQGCYSNRHFAIQLKGVIDTDTLMRKLGEPLVIPPNEGCMDCLLDIGKESKEGQLVADLLSETKDKMSQVIEGFSVLDLLELNLFGELDCSKKKKSELKRTCEKFCPEKEAKFDVPPPTYDYVHFNLAKYCWSIVKGVNTQCKKWGIIDFFEVSDM